MKHNEFEYRVSGQSTGQQNMNDEDVHRGRHTTQLQRLGNGLKTAQFALVFATKGHKEFPLLTSLSSQPNGWHQQIVSKVVVEKRAGGHEGFFPNKAGTTMGSLYHLIWHQGQRGDVTIRELEVLTNAYETEKAVMLWVHGLQWVGLDQWNSRFGSLSESSHVTLMLSRQQAVRTSLIEPRMGLLRVIQTLSTPSTTKSV